MKDCKVFSSVLVLIMVFIMTFLVFSGCSKKPEEYWDRAVSLVKQKKYEEGIDNYRYIAEHFPDDSLAIKAMFAMADIYKNNLNNIDSALAIYRRICYRYPNSDKTPNAMFMIGYIYANDVKDFEKARKSYEDFIKKYPEHILAQSAKWELKYLGKSLDEIPELQRVTKGE
ncbi:MAG: hypothetical protein DRP91_02265 [Candidatus Neomarinimicrobiota bacterium]|nr:tetratricopeptide repeat protein [Candidatus Neomarinimicrobiota bacterium]MCD6099253.1 tetratricopeptide repeat protein [Candidatus Neomarinimicrobiota bacterium]RKY46913.1 MAG: hypothetical protein DRP88_05625 [Candidatus Neomarinimicrobiota bacterium]RKY50232.1 MAG: hypothetical protein DRP91_02265 [Candidatus Neomarinimicrobiota bacterium]RKY54153.1 MAG: hypothetical protein DRP92_01840 [Candidatus Neomarinimicrobiota bacterium]